MTEPRIRILLLGPPEIQVDGKTVEIKRRLNRALLFFLAAQSYPVSRDEVSELLWPGESQVKARKNLREALSRLNKELGFPGIINTFGDQLSLDPSGTEVDFLQYKKSIIPLLSSSVINTSAVLPEWIVQEFKNDLALCRTNRFLQGVSLPEAAGFENWVEFNNQAYNLSRMKAIDRLIDHYISGGDLDDAIAWLLIASENNPLDEENNFVLLSALRDTGKMHELIAYVTYLEKLYLQQQEALPEKFVELKKAAEASGNYAVIKSAEWPEEEKGELKFIGREAALNQLGRALHRRGIVLIRGDAGIGKTRLLKQFYVQQAYSPRLIYCQGHPLGIRVAFYALFRALQIQIKKEEWERLDAQDQKILSGFFHETLQGPNALKTNESPDEWLPNLEDIFYAFLRLMEKISATQPLLFILDDAPLVDLASLSLIAFMEVHHFFEKFGLLVIIASSESKNKALNDLTQLARQSGKLETIDLEAFTSEEVKNFTYNMLGRTPGEDFVTKLMRLTGGNPFFLTQCLRSMKLTGEDLGDSSGCDPFTSPETITALVNEKIYGLEEESIGVLQAAAILGRQFSPDVLEEMINLESEKLLSGLDDLTRNGLLSINEKILPAGGYEFRHDIEREIVVQNLSPARKRDLHLRAARALEKCTKGIPRFSEEIAEHYEISQRQVEALEAWLEAGRYARSQYLQDDTYRVYGKALDMVMGRPQYFPVELVYQVVTEFGNYVYERDDITTYERVYQNCLSVGEATDNRMLIGTAYNGLSRKAFFTNKFAEAERFLSQATWFLEGSDFLVEKVKSVLLLGSINYRLDNYIEAREWMEKALELLENENAPYVHELKMDIITVLCTVLCFMGEPIKALELAEEMVNISHLTKRASAPLQANAILAMCEYFNDHSRRVLKIYEETIPLIEKMQLRLWHSLLDMFASMTFLETGNLDKAWYLADQAYKRELNFKTEKLSMHATKALADFYRFIGDTEKANEYYFELINSGLKNYQTTVSKFYVGFSLTEAGKKIEGQKWIDEAMQDAKLKGLTGIVLNARMYSLIYSAMKKSPRQAEKEAQEILKKMQERGIPEAKHYEKILQGMISEVIDEHETAISWYQRAVSPNEINEPISIELMALTRIIRIAGGDSPTGKNGIKRINEILEGMEKNATYPVVRRGFQKFRSRWRRYVNDVSTRKVYKDKYK